MVTSVWWSNLRDTFTAHLPSWWEHLVTLFIGGFANYCHLCAPADRPLGPFSCTLPCPVLSQRDLKPQSQPLATRIRFSRILHVRASISPCSILSTTSAKLLSQLHRTLLLSLKRRFPVLPLSALRTMSRRSSCLTSIGRTC